MKTMPLQLLLLLPLAAFSQQKQSDVKVISSAFERIDIVQMGPGSDMLEGLNNVVKERKIKNGVILSGIGSVTDYHFHVVTDKNLPPAEEFPKASVPMDLVSVQGYILNSRVHAHMALADENSMTGGHLEPGTKALTFFIITIGILPDSMNLESLDKYRY